MLIRNCFLWPASVVPSLLLLARYPTACCRDTI
jgi:hypothetical protein